MSLRDGQLTPQEFEAIALEHGALPAFRYYEDPAVACDGPDQGSWAGVFVQGDYLPAETSGAAGQVWICVDGDVVLIRGADFDRMLAWYQSVDFDVWIPEEDRVGTADRLPELQELADEIGGAVGFRSVHHGRLFQPIVVQVRSGPLDGMTRLSFAAEQVAMRDGHFARLLEELIPRD